MIKGSTEFFVTQSGSCNVCQVSDEMELIFRTQTCSDDEGLINQRISIPPFGGGSGEVNLNAPWETKGSL